VFEGVVPNCVIWRFERGNLTRRTHDGRRVLLVGGQFMFPRGIYSVPLASVFSVRVGGVSGADEIFAHAELGDTDFVCSKTARTGELRRMIFDPPQPLPYLQAFKERLLARKVTRFDESNWWKWGRRHPITDAPRVYVNHKTRNARPFFLNDCRHYDGSILGLFPHRRDADTAQLADLLNAVDWAELGFVCDGRYLFAQRSLEQTLLPESFAEFAVRGLV
jgi:adenine-specific DNA-methyltransferase